MLQPLRDKILVRPKKAETQTQSGIFIPDTASQEKPMEGEIIATGPGKMTSEGQIIPMELKNGDKILFSKYSPTEVKIDGEELYILSESDVLAIIK